MVASFSEADAQPLLHLPNTSDVEARPIAVWLYGTDYARVSFFSGTCKTTFPHVFTYIHFTVAGWRSLGALNGGTFVLDVKVGPCGG